DGQDHIRADDAGGLRIAAHSGERGPGDQADADAGADGTQTDGNSGGELEGLGHGATSDVGLRPAERRGARSYPSRASLEAGVVRPETRQQTTHDKCIAGLAERAATIYSNERCRTLAVARR